MDQNTTPLTKDIPGSNSMPPMDVRTSNTLTYIPQPSNAYTGPFATASSPYTKYSPYNVS